MNKVAEKIKKEYELIKEYVRTIVFDRLFFIPFSFCILITFSFTLFHRTLFIDDLLQDFYYGSFNRKLKALRWGQYFVDKVFSTTTFTPFINQIMGLVFLVLTIIVFGDLLFHFDKKREVWKYTLLSCIFISYPMIPEFFGYFEALTIPFDFFLVTVIASYHSLDEKHDLLDYLFEGFIVSFVMAGYESLIIAYISEVFIILYLRHVINEENCSFADWIKEGFSYSIPLFIGFVLKYVIGYLILFVTGLEKGSDGDTTIYWLTSGLYSSAVKVFSNVYFYIVRGLSYLPITVFAIASFIFIVLIIKKQKKNNYSIVIGILLYISMFGLSLIQGSFLMYRQCQPHYLFISFVVFMLFDELSEVHRYIKTTFIVLMLFVCMRQSIYTHTLFAIDNQRSNNELAIISEIGNRLYSEFDTKKEIVFCGKNHLGHYISDQITVPENSIERKFFNMIGSSFEEDNETITDTAVKSVINWAIRAFENQKTMEKLFSYCGYDIKTSDMYFDRNTNREYEKIALSNNMKPMEIKDMGDYILVYFGEVY